MNIPRTPSAASLANRRALLDDFQAVAPMPPQRQQAQPQRDASDENQWPWLTASTSSPPTLEPPTPAEIVAAVAHHHGMSVAAIAGRSRVAAIVAARAHAAFELRERAHLTLAEIGRFIGGLHHTSVMHLVAKEAARRAELRDRIEQP